MTRKGKTRSIFFSFTMGPAQHGLVLGGIMKILPIKWLNHPKKKMRDSVTLPISKTKQAGASIVSTNCNGHREPWK